MRRLPLSFSIAVLIASSVSPLAAWGPDGHRLAGRIAWLSLSTAAQEAVVEILPNGRYATLAEASFWADAYAREYDQYQWANQLHYVNIDPNSSHYVRQRDCRNGQDCVVEAIGRFAEVLSDFSRPLEERREALFFLAHFVQDIHQPLHVAHPDGRGGNRILVTWFGHERNLHRVWDEEISGRFLRRRLPITYWFFGQAWVRQASEMAKQQTPHAWRSATNPEQWANESLVLSQQHTYGVLSGMNLRKDYYQQSAEVAMTRIHMAGVRLAQLLETLLLGDRNQQ